MRLPLLELVPGYHVVAVVLPDGAELLRLPGLRRERDRGRWSVVDKLRGNSARAGTSVDDGKGQLQRGMYLDVSLHLVALLVGGAHPLDAEVRGGPGGEHLGSFR